MFKNLLLSAIIFCSGLVANDPPSVRATQKWVKKNGHKIIGDFTELLAIPNVALDRQNIRKNAEYISELFQNPSDPTCVNKIKAENKEPFNSGSAI